MLDYKRLKQIDGFSVLNIVLLFQVFQVGTTTYFWKLTFMYPCIVSVIVNDDQQDAVI